MCVYIYIYIYIHIHICTHMQTDTPLAKRALALESGGRTISSYYPYILIILLTIYIYIYIYVSYITIILLLLYYYYSVLYVYIYIYIYIYRNCSPAPDSVSSTPIFSGAFFSGGVLVSQAPVERDSAHGSRREHEDQGRDARTS